MRKTRSRSPTQKTELAIPERTNYTTSFQSYLVVVYILQPHDLTQIQHVNRKQDCQIKQIQDFNHNPDNTASQTQKKLTEKVINETPTEKVNYSYFLMLNLKLKTMFFMTRTQSLCKKCSYIRSPTQWAPIVLQSKKNRFLFVKTAEATPVRVGYVDKHGQTLYELNSEG